MSEACSKFGGILGQYGFKHVQDILYVTENEDMANLFQAIMELHNQAWFLQLVRDIRAFSIEHWSDFTGVVEQFTRATLARFIYSCV